jgi:DNA-binding NtrC family response regulator
MKTSFVADGDSNFLNTASRSLALSGYQVLTFQSGAELINALIKKPSLIIVGNITDLAPLALVGKIRKQLNQSFIVHMADNSADAIASIREGATEFIIRNGAEFVKLRTILDTLEKQSKKNKLSLFTGIKKVFVG